MYGWTQLQSGRADCCAGGVDSRVRNRDLAGWEGYRCFRALGCCDELATPMCPTVQFRTRCTSTVFVRRSLDLAVLISRSMVCGRMLGPMCDPWLDNTRHMTSHPANIILTLDNYTGGSVFWSTCRIVSVLHFSSRLMLKCRDEIIATAVSKHSREISLGGGVVNNLCGVIASLIFRACPWCPLPRRKGTVRCGSRLQASRQPPC